MAEGSFSNWFERTFPKQWMHIVLILVATVLVYGNILDNDFVWDDNHFILEWELTKSFNHLPDLIQGATPPQHEGVYRPLRSAFYMLAYQMYGVNTFWYKVQALGVHVVVTLLVYFLVKKITRSKYLSAMSALLFGIHPIHVESVTFTTTSFDVIGVIFMLVAVLLHLEKKWTWLSLLCAALGYFTYELTAVLPGLLVLCDVYNDRFRNWKKTISTQWVRYAMHILTLSTYLFIRFVVVDTPSRGGKGISVGVMAALSFIVFSRYLILLFFPIKQGINHEVVPFLYPNEVTPFADLSFSGLLGPIIIALLIVVIGFMALYKLSRKSEIMLFFTFGFLMCFAPVSQIIPLSTFIAERYLYLASIFACILLAHIIGSVNPRSGDQKNFFLGAVMCILLISFFSVQTVTQNDVWQNEVVLWESAIDGTEDYLYAQANLASAYSVANEYEKAISTSEFILARRPDDHFVHNNLAMVYQDHLQYDKAIESLKTGLIYAPDSPLLHQNLLAVECERGNYKEGIKWGLSAVELRPFDVRIHMRLALCYAEMGDLDSAYESVQTAKIHAPKAQSIIELEKRVNEAIAHSKSIKQ